MKKTRCLFVIIAMTVSLLILQSCFQYKTPTTVDQKQINFIIINNSPGVAGYPVTLNYLYLTGAYYSSQLSISIPTGTSATVSTYVDYSVSNYNVGVDGYFYFSGFNDPITRGDNWNNISLTADETYTIIISGATSTISNSISTTACSDYVF